jgi:general secretion pathway protein H
VPLPRRRYGPAASRGFTLIEVLAVVVIIAIATSVVLLSINVVGDDRDLEREARRLASLIELAADEAELQGRDFGVEFIRQGYRFVEYDPYSGSWSGIVGDDMFRQRRLPDDFEFRLIVEDKRIELGEEVASTGKAMNGNREEDAGPRNSLLAPRGEVLERYAPHSLILSSGDLSPFEAAIIRMSDDAEEVVRVLPSGRIEVGEDDEDLG